MFELQKVRIIETFCWGIFKVLENFVSSHSFSCVPCQNTSASNVLAKQLSKISRNVRLVNHLIWSMNLLYYSSN